MSEYTCHNTKVNRNGIWFQLQWNHSKQQQLYGTLKTEYTVIKYFPVIGAQKASATSAIHHDDHLTDGRSEFYWLVTVGLLPAGDEIQQG